VKWKNFLLLIKSELVFGGAASPYYPVEKTKEIEETVRGIYP
jgi:hypothetical protein